MVALSRTPDLLERIIAGEQVTDRRVADLVPTVRALASVDIGCHPDPAFVAALGARLVAEAAHTPARVADPAAPAIGRSRAATTTGPGTRDRSHPVIIFVGRGWPRLLAGVAASLIAVASIVGVVSRSALPGQALYPVKQVLDSAAVDLAGSDLDKGQAVLGQAEGHVADAARLVDGPRPAADDVNTALAAAVDTTTRGQALMQQAAARDHQRQALVVLRDFSTRLIPKVDALEGRVPPGSVASLQRLRAVLGSLSASTASAHAGLPGATPVAQGVGSSPPSSVGVSAGANPVVNAADPSATALPPGQPVTSGAPATGAIPGRAGIPAAPGVPGGAAVPGSSAPGTGAGGSKGGVRVGLPGVGAGSGGVAVGSSGAGARLTLPGATATVGVPVVTAGAGGVAAGGGGARLTLPGATATVGVPVVTAGGGGVAAGGGRIGVGLPSATVSLPLPGVTIGGGGLIGGGVRVGLPGARVSLPLPGATLGAGNGSHLGVGGPPVASSTCVLIICLP